MTPKEEALEIAIKTRDKLLEENPNTSAIIQGCFVVASSLGDTENLKWISDELDGYSSNTEVPRYRKFWQRKSGKPREDIYVIHSVLIIENFCLKEKTFEVWDPDIEDKGYSLDSGWCYRILSGVKNRCLIYLTNKITELRYGGLISSIVDKMIDDINIKISKMNVEAMSELQSIYNNLSSGKSETDWSKVAHSCRRVLKIVADSLFPSQNEQYIDSIGKRHNVKEDDYMNRLLAFVDTKRGNGIISAEIKYLSSYLDNIRDFSGKGEHSKIDKVQAEQIAVHTYLILSQILKLTE